MTKYFFSTIIIISFLSSCSKKNNFDTLTYTTTIDSVMLYYNTGWKQIMDEGNYAKAEISYRKALKLDPDFLIGKSVLARLTTNLKERIVLYDELEKRKTTVSGDERLVLDVYIALTKFTNIREQKPEKAEEALNEAFAIGEQNLREIIHKYPKEVYLKSEYIEVLHAIYGAEKALDSLYALTSENQKDNPFLLGYAAIMEAELKNYNLAIQKANRLKKIINDTLIAKSDAILADIYFKMDSLKIAKKHADRAFKIDSRNLDVSRLKIKINEKLMKS